MSLLVLLQGGSGISATLAVTESADTLVATAKLAIAGQAAIAESADQLTAAGKLAIAAQLAVTESPDALVATAKLAIAGQAAIAETADQLTAVGQVAIAAAAAIVEADDALVATASGSGAAEPEPEPAPAPAPRVPASGGMRGGRHLRAGPKIRGFSMFTEPRPAPVVDRSLELRELIAKLDIQEDEDKLEASAIVRSLPALLRRRTLAVLAIN